jgi:hypothetical protein
VGFGRRDEGAEEFGVGRGSGVCQLRVPLDAQGEGVLGVLNRLDQAFRVPAYRNPWLGYPLEGLMVTRDDLNLFRPYPHRGREFRAWCDPYAVQDPSAVLLIVWAVLGEVL